MKTKQKTQTNLDVAERSTISVRTYISFAHHRYYRYYLGAVGKVRSEQSPVGNVADSSARARCVHRRDFGRRQLATVHIELAEFAVK